jgi:arylsulfatase
MLGTRAIWHRGWKASALSPAAPSAWGDFAEQRWELFDTENDPTECHDLAEQEPARLRELVALWWAEAGAYQALPLESRNAVEILTTERPQLAKPRERYVYYPGGAEIPESVAPNIRNRSYTIAADVTIDTPEAEGVLLAQGARFGGHALYIKDGTLKYVYDFVGLHEQIVESTEKVPTGTVVLAASFEKEGDAMPTQGTLSLYIDDRKVGEGSITTQPGKFSLAGEGLNVGKDGGEPVTDDYPGTAPWPLVGATIERVIIDVSGEAYVDLEKEAHAMLSRE